MKTFKDYVIHSVLEHIHKRDAKINELRAGLESCNIFKCNRCKKYGNYTERCICCDHPIRRYLYKKWNNPPKNIQEYVVKKIIEHIKYRSDELDDLKDALDKFNLAKCSFCKKYANFDASCDGCDNVSCSKCKQIKNYRSWNLSGVNKCSQCPVENFLLYWPKETFE